MQELSSSTFLYKAEVDGTHELFLTLDEDEAVDSIRPTDANGNPVAAVRMSLSDGNISGDGRTGDDLDILKGFPLMAGHLLAQWKRDDRPPQEILKFFA
ncbi:hypothetical protein PV396_20175 [Streptomyces sp. ME02-8801-2C]|uniref:hypothetical protein n=1 Tax=Streptomyces sp. ME02-8801-2C TaxID=3028680 RepID=UPI0029B42B11|nr:hypothetical protein [Streptomyces sp. ME02-8801-2C]MDX3454234.1 hypothetical protein [Streptomyces sp. ME02-8801-2C]